MEMGNFKMANKPWLRKETENEITVMGCKIVLQTLSFGESRKMASDAMKINPMTGKVEKFDPSLLGVLNAISHIKDWDLTDDNENKLPITIETFDNILDSTFAGQLIQEIEKATKSKPTAQEKKK
jgi:hypothetical protein